MTQQKQPLISQRKHICCWERENPHRCILCCQCGKKCELVPPGENQQQKSSFDVWWNDYKTSLGEYTQREVLIAFSAWIACENQRKKFDRLLERDEFWPTITKDPNALHDLGEKNQAEITRADIDKAIKSIPKPQTYDDYMQTYTIHPGGIVTKNERKQEK